MSSTEIILNSDGSIYHLGLLPEHIADIVITVGDPGRVEKVTRNFDVIHHKSVRREFVAHVGEYSGVPMTVLSTGIGVDNTEIAMVEVDALANLDLTSRQVCKKTRSLLFCRIGTSGAIQPEIEVGSFLVSKQAIGLDNLMPFYRNKVEPENKSSLEELQDLLQLQVTPYVGDADEGLLKCFKDIHQGITISSPGFYAPQGRQIRMPLAVPDYFERLKGFQFHGQHVSNFEMETSAIYAFATMLGHKAVSLNAILANRASGVFSEEPSKVVNGLIDYSLDRLVSYWKTRPQRPS